MENKSIYLNIVYLITEDNKFSFTIISFASVATIFLNLNTVSSPILGIVASILFLLINSTFVGQALLQNENLFTKFLLGNLIIIVTLGLIGWTVMILYNLDNTRTTIVLLITATFASILNKRMKSRNVTE